MTPESQHNWVLMVYRIPSQPSRLRLQVWRRLQQLGAAYLQDAVCVLPDSPSHRHELKELAEGIRKNGGLASIFHSTPICEGQDEAVVEAFRTLAEDRYQTIASRIDAALQILTEDVDMSDIEVAEESLIRERVAYERAQKISFFGGKNQSLVEERLETLRAELDGIRAAMLS